MSGQPWRGKSADQRDTTPLVDGILARLPGGRTESDRFLTLLETLTAWKDLFEQRRVLDFGASWGTSMVALLELGAREVVGVEPDSKRVEEGRVLLAEVAPTCPLTLLHTPDTTALPFVDGEFDFVLANAVIEHIPQPRDAFIRELWRVLSPGGHLMVNETPNKYFPKEIHTTNLWFNHWLPSRIARQRAVKKRRFDASRTDWTGSGWRGLGFYELSKLCPQSRLLPETTELRHRLLTRMGLPASVLDPYPTWVLQKVPRSQG